MRICWFGIYNPEYPRNRILIRGLKNAGVEIVECREEWGCKMRYWNLYKKLKRLRNDYDAVYAAYPASTPALIAKLFSQKPVIVDAFYSMFDSAVNDRKEIKWYHPQALKLLFFDWLSVLMADLVITDTEEHKKYWSKWPLIGEGKINTVYLGVDGSTYKPVGASSENALFTLHFHGNYIPLHGVKKIAEAAEILRRDKTIHFRVIGSGGEQDRINNFIGSKNLDNFEQIDRMPASKLNEYLNKADVVLGIFGDTVKARRVIPNKVYEGMAVGKPVITMDSPAVREIFSEDDLCLVKNDAGSLAEAIKKLQKDSNLRDRIAAKGYNKVMRNYTPAPLGNKLKEIIAGILKNKNA